MRCPLVGGDGERSQSPDRQTCQEFASLATADHLITHNMRRKIHPSIALNNTIVQLAIVAIAKRKRIRNRSEGSRKGCMTRPRVRKSVIQVFNELGRNMFCRAFRMHIEAFFKLYVTIKLSLFKAIAHNESRNFALNGIVHPTVRLACCLRVFAGGDPVDIGLAFGVSRTVVFDSVNFVTQASNTCDDLAIVFPESHEEQRQIAAGFLAKSAAGIHNCTGATDGLLIWLLCVTEKEAKTAGAGQTKFFCGRKKRFGLNMQATCDHLKRFTDISIRFPGATSDFLAFPIFDRN